MNFFKNTTIYNLEIKKNKIIMTNNREYRAENFYNSITSYCTPCHAFNPSNFDWRFNYERKKRKR